MIRGLRCCSYFHFPSVAEIYPEHFKFKMAAVDGLYLFPVPVLITIPFTLRRLTYGASTCTHQVQWRIQDFCEGDAAGVWPPLFFGRDDSHFLWQIVSAHRRSQDFHRVGALRGGSGRGTMEGPKAPNEARSAGAPGVELSLIHISEPTRPY